MLHATPDNKVREDWHGAVAMLQSNCSVDYAVLRQLDAGVSLILSCNPSPAPTVLVDNEIQASEGRFGHWLLETESALCVPDTQTDARWDAMAERRAGFRGYCGEPLSWPDRDPFGCLELLSHDAFDNATKSAAPGLLSCVATGMRAQLEVLQLRQDASQAILHDPLTGLASAALFAEFAHNQIELQARSGGELWMLMWSLADFQSLRRRMDESEIDLVLRGCAEGARGCVRRSDVLARLDENRFAMLLGQANEFAASAVADRIRRTLQRMPLPGGGKAVISSGLSPYTMGEDPGRWRKRCERALASALKAGGNRTIVRIPST